MSDPIRWDVSMTQDGIGRFVSYHDYAMKDEQCEALSARVAELEAALAKLEAVASVPVDALTCVGRARFPKRGGNAGISWYVEDAMGETNGFRSGSPANGELLFVLPATAKRAMLAASQPAKEPQP